MAGEPREHALESALLRLYERWWHELGYRAEGFRQTIVPGCKRYKGGVRTVEDVLTKSTSVFTRLRNRPNLTVEHLVLSGEWDDLIREEYRVLAGKRLAGESK